MLRIASSVAYLQGCARVASVGEDLDERVVRVLVPLRASNW